LHETAGAGRSSCLQLPSCSLFFLFLSVLSLSVSAWNWSLMTKTMAQMCWLAKATFSSSQFLSLLHAPVSSLLFCVLCSFVSIVWFFFGLLSVLSVCLCYRPPPLCFQFPGSSFSPPLFVSMFFFVPVIVLFLWFFCLHVSLCLRLPAPPLLSLSTVFFGFSRLLVCGLSLAFIRPENAMCSKLGNGMHHGGEW